MGAALSVALCCGTSPSWAADAGKRFAELAGDSTTDRSDWNAFCEGLDKTDYPELRRFLQPIIVAPYDLSFQRRILIGFVTCVSASPTFRDAFTADLLDRQHFPPGQPNDALRTALQVLLTAYEERADSALIDPQVVHALHRHRSFRSTITGGVDLENRLHQVLMQQVGAYADGAPDQFAALFRTLLDDPERLTDAELARWPEGGAELVAVDNTLRRRALSAVVEPAKLSSVVTTPPSFVDLVAIHVTALRAGEDIARVQPALHQLLERGVALWSASYAGWGPPTEGAPPFSVKGAFASERQLRAALMDLASRPVPGGESHQVSQYIGLLEAMGGWPASNLATEAPETPPSPAWVRALHEVAGGTGPESLPVPLARSIHGFIRLSSPGLELNEVTVDPSKRYNAEQAAKIGGPILEAGVAQGLPLSYGLDGNDLQPLTQLEGPSDPFLPLVTPSLDRLWHPDHRRALALVLGQVYGWRADIAYRAVGLNGVGEKLTDSQKRHLENLYQQADTLLKAAGDQWVVGMGLFGRVLDFERQRLLDECAARLKQLEAGQDYVGNTFDWPENYVGKLLQRLDRQLAVLETLQGGQSQEFSRQQLMDEVEIKKTAAEAARDRAEAADYGAAAEGFLVRAIGYEISAQETKVRIAQLEVKRADYLKKAAERTRDAGEADLKADTVLLEAEQFALDALDEQISLLREQIEPLPETINQLQQDLGTAQDNLSTFVARAVERQNELNPPQEEGGVLVITRQHRSESRLGG